MRHIAIIAAMSGLVACDRWDCDPDALWALKTWRIGGLYEDEGAEVGGRVAPGGETIALVADPLPTVRFGDQRLTGPHLVRVDRTGAIVAVTPLPDPAYSSVYRALEIDARGRPVVVSCCYPETTLIGYDESFVMRWSTPAAVGSDLNLGYAYGVGADGSVAYFSNSPSDSSVHAIGDDGVVRWTVPLSDREVRRVVIATGGVVVVYTTTHRRRFAAADGALREEVESANVAGVSPDGLEVIEQDETWTLREPSGAVRWTRAMPGLHSGTAYLGPGDDVTFLAVHGPDLLDRRVVRLDGATGAVLGTHDQCPEFRKLVGVDGEGYLTLGIIGGPTKGMIKFPLPGAP